MEDVLDVSSENLQQLKRRSTDDRGGYTASLYPHFFGIIRSDEICDTEESALGSGIDQVMYTPAMEVNTDSLLDRIRAVEDRLDRELEAVQEKVVYVNASEVNGMAGSTNASSRKKLAETRSCRMQYRRKYRRWCKFQLYRR